MRGSRKSLFKGFDACGPPANHFLKGLAFPRSAKVIFRKVWHFRAWRKSFPKRFGISALGESCFPKGLAFPRMAKVISRKVWHFRAWRKLFPERFGISALGESHFPNGLELVVAKIWNKNLSGFWIYNYQGASIETISTIFSTYFVLHKKIVLWDKIRK